MSLSLWNRYHCFALLAASLVFMFVQTMLLFVFIGTASMLWLFLISKKELSALKPYGGWANRVTAIRFLALMVLAVTYIYLTNFQIAVWLSVLIPLDGIDGYIARKRNEQTNMGAYLDMETDVLFVCVASCILYIRDLTGAEILVVAFFRYFYVFIVYLLGLTNVKEERTKIGPIVAVYIFVAVTLAFLVPEQIRIIVIYSALVLLVISFSYSFILLLKAAGRN